MTEGIEFIMIEKDFELFYKESAYKKCQKMVNYICKYNKLSENCIKLYKNCEKFKEFKDLCFLIENKNGKYY